MNTQQKILSVVLFTSFYILPHYLNFKKNDISFSGDKNFLESEKINNFKDLYILYLNVFYFFLFVHL